MKKEKSLNKKENFLLISDIYHQIFDSLMEHFSSSKYREKVRHAREEFYKKVGIFHEESSDFEMRMAQFVDWYLFSNILNTSKKSLEVCLEEKAYKIKDDLKAYYKNISHSRQSLFEFIKLKKGDIYIRDLFSQYTLIVKNSSFTEGFRREDFFQTRIIPHEDYFIFAPFFCFHPPQTRKYILKSIKKIKEQLKEGEEKKTREDFLFKLLIMRYKYEQYKHVALNEIYSNQSKLKI